MKLVPTDPPGRSSRKARRFAQDMRELRAQGYTFVTVSQLYEDPEPGRLYATP